MKTCKGKNCSEVVGNEHSLDCIKDHDNAVSGASNKMTPQHKEIRDLLDKMDSKYNCCVAAGGVHYAYVDGQGNVYPNKHCNPNRLYPANTKVLFKREDYDN